MIYPCPLANGLEFRNYMDHMPVSCITALCSLNVRNLGRHMLLAYGRERIKVANSDGNSLVQALKFQELSISRIFPALAGTTTDFVMASERVSFR
jgi:hypothetical protein